MSQQISINVLLSLLSDANKKNALLEIDIAKLKSQINEIANVLLPPLELESNPELESKIADIPIKLESNSVSNLELESKIAALNADLDQTKKDLDIANKKIASYEKNCELNKNNFLSLKNAFNKFDLLPPELLPHAQYIEKVDRIVSEKSYEKLLKYGSFKLKGLQMSCIELCSDIVLKHIIDNCKNLNGSFMYTKIKLFTYIVACRKNNLEIVKYLIEEKNANLEEEYTNGSTPIYFACQNSSFEVINLILDHNVKLGFKNTNDKTQSDYLKENRTLTDDQKKIIEDRIQSMIASKITQNE